MTDPGTVETRSSLLLGAPPEIQGLIFDNLNRYDLKRLCLTCKTIKAIVLPKLYRKVVVKAPQRFSRLPSLEGLLGSNGDCLKHTTELIVLIQQNPLRQSQQGPEDLRPPEQVLEEKRLQFCLPQTSTSNALNTIVRLLILKLPKNQLHAFCWRHCCELDVSTWYLLLKRQRDSLGAFSCNRCSSSCDTAPSAINGLYDLSIESMDPEGGGRRWAACAIAVNARTLNHLSLGFTTRIAHEYALRRRSPTNEMSASFGVGVKEFLQELHVERLQDLSLETLRLCGLDIERIILGELGLHIDFNTITELRLESCPGLSQALILLTGQGDSSQLALRALEDLSVRVEDPDPALSNSLEIFLTSIRGLVHLKILIDYALGVQDLEPILKVHGKTLKTLVWDERRGPRTDLATSTSRNPGRFGRLFLISQYCASLTTLGISLDWEAINNSDKYHAAIRNGLGNMPYLTVLNIRNLPDFTGRAVMPMDHFVKGLAASFVNIANKKRKSTLTTIALGALLYRDINIGTHHIVHTAVSDLIRFRAYHIDYNYRSPSGVSPVLSEIMKGAASVSEDGSYPPGLIYNYWLG